jgi:hypothetical protein
MNFKILSGTTSKAQTVEFLMTDLSNPDLQTPKGAGQESPA